MSSRIRVTNEIDEGYNFDVEHKNWVLDHSWKESLFLILFTFLPSLIINIAYLLFRDILLSQMLFQLTLVIFPVIYKQFFPLNLDILYIQSLKHVPTQINKGIVSFFFFLIAIPSVALLLRYFQIDILEGMVLLIPSGLTPFSRFQRGVHIIYFLVISIVYGILAPIAEFRYYLVFLQSKFNNNKCTYIIMFLLLNFNSLVVIVLMAAYAKSNFVYLFLALIVLGNYRTLVNKSDNGIITCLLRQFGINFGIIVTMILAIYTHYVIEMRHDISLFIDKNALDMMIDGFIWDDPNYDSSF